MPKIEIKQENYSVNAETIIEKKVKPYGKDGAHITMPKKHLGQDVLVIVFKEAKQWLTGYKKKYAKSKKVDFPKPKKS